MTTMRSLIVSAAMCAISPAGLAQGHAGRTLTADDLSGLTWRSVGPANMGGRVSALAMSETNPKIVFVGYATGGLWKSTNHGTTFTPVFDATGMNSIGALALADAPPSWAGWDAVSPAERPAGHAGERPDAGTARILWVGTGEGNGRNSSSWGNGVYRSTDGGATFEHLGLDETHDIPALAVDPADPDTCYVAALGHLWGPNPERGLYRTTDGGRTWDHVLAIDEHTGACDVIVSPEDPRTIFAAMYARHRTPWSFRSGGAEGGVYRSRDGGDSWEKLSGGLPAATGRIGLWICPANPSTVYALVESAEDGHVGDSIEDRSRGGGLFRSDDGGDTWTHTTDFMARPFYFSRVRTDPADCDRVYLPGFHLAVSDDGGRTFYNEIRTPHVDYHAMIVDPGDPEHLLVGNDGGFYASWDRGRTWTHANTMAVAQFYNVAVDDSDPYRIAGGLQDNGSWIGTGEVLREAPPGAFMGRSGAITNKHWDFVWGGDGFTVAFDPEDPDTVYATSQGGYMVRVDLGTGQTRSLRPAAKEGEPAFRFNWNAPFFVSPHDPSVLYLGGNRVFRLDDRGDRWTAISPDLSRNDVARVVTVGSEAETHGTVVSLAESARTQGLLWAGTDDGRVHVTQDAGTTWTEVTPGDVGGLYVSSIAASTHDPAVAYVAVDGHRSDRFDPILLRTDDLGRTWTRIESNLPDGEPVDVVHEDPRNPAVLYVGTERSLYVSIDGGGAWTPADAGELPPCRVDDFAIQTREMDLVVGTHGRSVWVLDDASALSALTPGIVGSAFHVFDPMPARPRQRLNTYELTSDFSFVQPNPPVAAPIHYWLRDRGDDDASVEIKDVHGRTLRTLTGPARAGLNRVEWDMQADGQMQLGRLHPGVDFVPAGSYTVVVTVGDHTGVVTLEVGAERGGAAHALDR